MDFFKVPLGLGMGLATNFQAMNIYSSLTEEEKQAVLARAHQAQSEREMHQIIDNLADFRTQ